MKKCVYGIVRTNEDKAITIPGLARPAFVVASGGIGCLCADWDAGDPSALPKEDLLHLLLEHQKVTEYVMRYYSVLPMRFGTVLEDIKELQHVLTQGRQQFATFLQWIEDKLEMELAATWDPREVLREIGNEEDISRTREAILARCQGQPSYDDRVALGKLVQESLERQRRSYQDRIINHLRRSCLDLRSNGLPSEEMVANISFLLEKGRQQEFEYCVQDLDHLLDDRLSFRIIGPLPAYTFATVEVSRPDEREIAEAKELLHLGEAPLSQVQVRTAYRRVAAEIHPDRNPGDRLAREKFVRICRASNLLMNCCQNAGSEEVPLFINISRPSREFQRLRLEELSGAGAS